jgi:hypothetical protein
MKAVVQDRYGPPDVLELREIERPAVGDGDVLVRVRAASVNPQDWHLMRASPFVIRATGTGLRVPKSPVRLARRSHACLARQGSPRVTLRLAPRHPVPEERPSGGDALAAYFEAG